jgi:MFS family permease
MSSNQYNEMQMHVIYYTGFGFTTLTSQLLTAPPCLVATLGVLAGGYLAGKYNRRSPLLVAGSFIVATGYLFLLLLRDKWGKNNEI